MFFKVILNIVITIAIPVLTNALRGYLEARMGASVVSTINKITENVVKTVEMTNKNSDANSANKFSQAEDLLIKILGQKGIELSSEEIQSYIESAVLNIQKGWNGNV